MAFGSRTARLRKSTPFTPGRFQPTDDGPSDLRVPPPIIPHHGAGQEPEPAWLADVLRTAVACELPPVSLPGGPSAHPGRPPVPPGPSAAESFIGANFLGRPIADPAMYRSPLPQTGSAEVDMCAGCDVDCCTNHVIPVNCFDAWRIHSTLHLPFKDFLGLIPHRGACPTHHVRIHSSRFTLMLRRRADKSCQFLVRVGGQRRCGIHAVRPDACRIFPFVADLALQSQQPGAAVVQLHPSQCPWAWPAQQEVKDRVLGYIRDNLEHRTLDREVLSDWYWAIGVEKTVDNFFTFLEEDLSRRMLHPEQPSRYTTRLW